MSLTDVQLATYLLETREVVQLMLRRFDGILAVSDEWARTKASADSQLAEWQTGKELDDRLWRKTMWLQEEFQARYFLAVEAFLAGWARLSLLLFPIEGRGPSSRFRTERGRRLRETLGVGGDSVLGDRELRDSWMHFDERLDQAFINGTFGERHRFLRASEAGQFVNSTLVLLEVDSLVIHYPDRNGRSMSMDLRVLKSALVDLRAALKGTVAG